MALSYRGLIKGLTSWETMDNTIILDMTHNLRMTHGFKTCIIEPSKNLTELKG